MSHSLPASFVAYLAASVIKFLASPDVFGVSGQLNHDLEVLYQLLWWMHVIDATAPVIWDRLRRLWR